jgi:FkbM family methyltransferase
LSAASPLHRVRRALKWRFDIALGKRGWQLVPAVPNEPLHARAPDDFELRGVRLKLAGDWATPLLRAAIYDGYYEAREAQILQSTMRPDDRVLEIGCGIGFLATIASQMAGDQVYGYEANPAMVAVAQETLERNGATGTVTTGLMARNPTADTATFYVHRDFWTSSLVPDPEAAPISVPVLDFAREVSAHDASYLLVDIEGGETELLLGDIPPCVRKLCVECHPAVSRRSAVKAMLVSLLSGDFSLDLVHSTPPVLYFER